MAKPISEQNERECLFTWASAIGANPAGKDNELMLLRKITAKYMGL